MTRYRRTDEFLDVLRLEWTSATPFDYAGEFYHVQQGLSGVRPPLGSFLVRADSPGIRIERTWDHLGLRASRSDDVIFADTPVPPGATAGLQDSSLPVPPDPGFLAWNALGLAALYLGVAAAARDWLVGFLGERTPSALGRPLATLPRFETAVGEIEAALTGAGDLVDAARRTRSPRPCSIMWTSA